jgi:adenylate cyclase
MAYHAAVRILSTVRELSEQGIIPETKIGMGLHTGEVITGNIGNENRKQYSISGTAVIIAFRIEQLNKDLGTELLITDSVRGRVRENSNEVITSLGPRQLKGLDTAVEVYKVEVQQEVFKP